MSDKNVIIEKDEGIITVSLNRPDALMPLTTI
jgi:enoyl-CoA hydratase/carnithine racemase